MDVRQVPVIDIGALMGSPAMLRSMTPCVVPSKNCCIKMIANVRSAASEWGFFYVANHGVPEQEVDDFQQAMRSFFRLPVETKRTILRTAENSRGYVVDELTKSKPTGRTDEDSPTTDKIERLDEDQNQWLDEVTLPGFRNEMQSYYKKMERIARRLLKVFAVALGEKPAFFDKFYDGNHSIYHHTDFGALTILLQDDEVASLQVLHRDSQTWVNVPPRMGTYTINVGDMVQVWSNDKFVAPVHRVVASDKSGRFSAPFFYNPSNHVTEGEVPNYRPFNWRKFQLARQQGNYADVGKENQIGDFKIHGPVDVANA
ncbi:Isopenicillin N synthase-like [Phytophthora cactorum]|nr:Isopenicillin N synthase-like [Phytophthora cactorum]